MADQSRSQLLTRKADLLAALRLLEQDHEEGTIDAKAYGVARERYEHQVAAVLEKLDEASQQESVLPVASNVFIGEQAKISPWIFVVGTAMLVVGALGIFLVSALHRTSNNANTALGQSTTRPASAQLIAAERQVQAHPKSVADLIALGNAYLENGQPTFADGTYRTAMQLSPASPQPLTLHAMIIGYAGKPQEALALLHGVEKKHPAYSRAWLLDGVFSSRDSRHPGRSIRAWRHFLLLNHNSVMSKQVESWVAAAEKALRRAK